MPAALPIRNRTFEKDRTTSCKPHSARKTESHVPTLLFSSAGCSDGGDFTEKSWQSEEAIEQIVVDVADRALEIGASEDGYVRIDYFDGEKEHLEIVPENGQLTVRLVYNKNWTDYIGGKPSAEYRKIKISVPNDTVAALSAKTTNENIRLAALSFTESVSLDSTGGSIVCERVNVGKSIDLTAKNGDITGSVLGGMDDFSISCTYKKGDCNLPESKPGGTKSFTASCNNGNIDIEFVK